MKKILILALAVLTAISFTACSSEKQTGSVGAEIDWETPESEEIPENVMAEFTKFSNKLPSGEGQTYTAVKVDGIKHENENTSYKVLCEMNDGTGNNETFHFVATYSSDGVLVSFEHDFSTSSGGVPNGVVIIPT